MEFNLAHPSPGNWEEVRKDNISLKHMNQKKTLSQLQCKGASPEFCRGEVIASLWQGLEMFKTVPWEKSWFYEVIYTT